MTRATVYLVVYFLAAALPSAPVFQRFFGVGGALAYVVAVGIIVALLPRVLPFLIAKSSRRIAIALGAFAWLAILTMFAVAYPRLNTHEPGKGSDRDDALNIGVHELMHGRYPYGVVTYLGAPVSPGPGALLQSVPFWLIGNAAFQNFFWLPAFVIAAAALSRDVRIAIAMTLLTIALSPALIGHEVMVGGDYFANSLYVLTASILLLLSLSRTMPATILAAALLGFLLSSRANYVFIVPPLLAYVWSISGLKRAVVAAAVIGTALVAASLPFYLYDPSRFGPLAAQNKFAGFNIVLPHADIFVAATLTLLTLGLSLWVLITHASRPRVILACAIILFYPALIGFILDCIKQRTLIFDFAGWGSCATIFAALALAQKLTPAQTEPA